MRGFCARSRNFLQNLHILPEVGSSMEREPRCGLETTAARMQTEASRGNDQVCYELLHETTICLRPRNWVNPRGSANAAQYATCLMLQRL